MKHKLNKVQNYPNEFNYGVDQDEVMRLTTAIVTPIEGQVRQDYQYLEDVEEIPVQEDICITELLDRLYWMFTHAGGLTGDFNKRYVELLTKTIDKWDEFIEKEQRAYLDYE